MMLSDYSYLKSFVSSELVSLLIKGVDGTVAAFETFLRLVNSVCIVILIGIFLFIYQPIVSTSITFLIGLFYLSSFSISSSKLTENSKSRMNNFKYQIKILNESLGSVKDLIISSKQLVLSDSFRRSDYKRRLTGASYQMHATTPRYIIECTSIILVALLAFVLFRNGMDTLQIISIVGLWALGAQKIIPSI